MIPFRTRQLLRRIAVTVLVLVQRIRELNSGETDDLDKY